MDAIKAAFESQFGTEWSVPVKNVAKATNTSSNDADSDTNDTDTIDASSNDTDTNDTSLNDADSNGDSDQLGESESDEPVIIKHTGEPTNLNQPLVSRNQRRKFMNAGAPKDDREIIAPTNTKEENDDLKNDLALQRLIEESHILSSRPKNQEFTGADISGSGDPLEQIGSSRLKIMQSRLAKAGAKTKSPRMPQAMAVGIRDKAKERKDQHRREAREAGIVIAKDRHVKSKNRFRDRGLKINTVGRASEHGIHVSAAEIARLTGKNRKVGGRKR